MQCAESQKTGKIALGRWVWTLEGAGRSRAGAVVWGERVRRLKTQEENGEAGSWCRPPT